jgi:hypothetical protein
MAGNLAAATVHLNREKRLQRIFPPAGSPSTVRLTHGITGRPVS